MSLSTSLSYFLPFFRGMGWFGSFCVCGILCLECVIGVIYFLITSVFYYCVF